MGQLETLRRQDVARSFAIELREAQKFNANTSRIWMRAKNAGVDSEVSALLQPEPE